MTKALAALGAAALTASLALAQAPPPPPAPAAAPAAESPELAAVRRAIDQGNAQWSEGWLKGDAAKVAAVFAENGVQLSGNGKVIKGRQAIAERQKAAMQSADPGVKVTVTTTTVWLDGDTAYETGKYRYEYTEKGKPGVDEGQYVTVWKRQLDGSWKLSMDMGVPHP